MLAHKKSKGKAALDRLKVMEGCPHPYDKMKKMCIPRAVKNIRLKPGRKFCRLGDLSSLAGWRHNDLINKLEAKRQVKNAAFYEKKKAMAKILDSAKEATSAETADIDAQLAALGYGDIKPNYSSAADEKVAGGEEEEEDDE